MDRIAKVAITDLQKGVRRFVYEHDAHSDPFCDLINIALKTNKSKTYCSTDIRKGKETLK